MIDEVLRRNSREVLKKEKHPLDIRAELPRMVEEGYERVSEEDLVRLQWHGVYHDRPKSGGFMLRVKLPGGILAPSRLAAIGEIAERFGRGYGEITTRQDLQLHSIAMKDLEEIFITLERSGMTSLGACGDVVRNITGCPLAGISKRELFDVRVLVTELTHFFEGNREYSDLPRKHKITVSACPDQCNVPEIHCQAFVGILRGDERGFALRLGGGLSTVPRLSQNLGVFVPFEETLEVARATLDVWKDDPSNRRSFAKARLKFFLDKIGPEEYRGRIEEKLGRRLDSLDVIPPPPAESTHLGVQEEKRAGLYSVGFPVSAGRFDGRAMIRVAKIAARFGDDIRLTRQQNLIVTGIPERDVDRVRREVETSGLPVGNDLAGRGIACTGGPHCNFALTETKGRLVEIQNRLHAELGNDAAGIHIHLDGCPHACGHHWTGDIGLMGTTQRRESGERVEAYSVILGGGRGAQAAIGRPVIRRILAENVADRLVALVRAYRDSGARSFREFNDRTDEQALVSLLAGPDFSRPSSSLSSKTDSSETETS